MRLTIATLLMLIVLLSAQGRTATTVKDSVTASTVEKTAPWFVERLRLTGGFFVPISNTDIQVGIHGGDAGTAVDFERDLGYNDYQTTFLANLQWRISRRSRLSVNYYNIPRSSSHQIDKDIHFNGQIFPVNATISSYLNTAIYQISYGYAIVAKPKFEIGVIIGTHLVGGKVGLSASSSTNSGAANTTFGFTAPLPDLGIWGGYAFSNRFAMNFDADYLSLTVGGVSGSIFAYNLLCVYKLIDKLDLSLGYSGLNFNVNLTKNSSEAHFNWSYNGPALGLTYSFGKKSWGH